MQETRIERITRTGGIDRLNRKRGDGYDLSRFQRHATIGAKLRNRDSPPIRDTSQGWFAIPQTRRSFQLNFIGKEYVHFAQRFQQIASPFFIRIVAWIERSGKSTFAGHAHELFNARPKPLLDKKRRNVQVLESAKALGREIRRCERGTRSRISNQRAIRRRCYGDSDSSFEGWIHHDPGDVHRARREFGLAQLAPGIGSHFAYESDGIAEFRNAAR